MGKVLAVLGLAVAVAGAVVTWSALGALDDAWADLAGARRDVVDVERTLGARLDEQLGMAGTDSGFPTDDDEFAALLGFVVGRADDADALAARVTEIEEELHDHVQTAGRPDERLLASLQSVVRDLRDAVTDPREDAVGAARDRARVAVGATGAATVALWSGALWWWRPSPRRPSRSPTADPVRA